MYVKSFPLTLFVFFYRKAQTRHNSIKIYGGLKITSQVGYAVLVRMCVSETETRLAMVRELFEGDAFKDLHIPLLALRTTQSQQSSKQHTHTHKRR